MKVHVSQCPDIFEIVDADPTAQEKWHMLVISREHMPVELLCIATMQLALRIKKKVINSVLIFYQRLRIKRVVHAICLDYSISEIAQSLTLIRHFIAVKLCNPRPDPAKSFHDFRPFFIDEHAHRLR